MTNQNQTEQALQFLELLLPKGSFYYSTSCIGPSTDNKWSDTPHTDFNSMVDRSLDLSAKGNNTYFALSAFREGYYFITKPDGTTKSVFRTQENSCYQKALWLDIDCAKPDSPYPTHEEGVQALTNFVVTVGLPIPTIVFSGRGVHAYWPFIEMIQTNQWNHLASMLRALTVHFNFVVDHSRTVDSASVLRLPGTMNYRSDGARHVTLEHLSEAYPVVAIASKITECVQNNHVAIDRSPKKTTLPLVNINLPAPPDGLSFSGMEDFNTSILRHPARIAEQCKQIQTAGLGNYHQWYFMMTVMKYCYQGNKVAHLISQTNPSEYSENTTEQYYQSALSSGAGPTLCSTFNVYTPGICDNCVYKDKIATPLLLGEPYIENKPVMIPTASVEPGSEVSVVSCFAPSMEIQPYSDRRFTVAPGIGIVWNKKVFSEADANDPDEENKAFTFKPTVISDTELYIHSICVDQTDGEVKRSYVIRKQPQGKAAEDILFPIDTALGSSQLIRWLGNHGMLPKKPEYNKPMSDFMSTYLAAIQNKLKEIVVRDSFGWVKNHDKTTGESYKSFIVGETLYSPYGQEKVKLAERAASMAIPFQKEGTLENWKMIPDMYRQLGQPYAQLMLLNSFGATFMKEGVGTATNIVYSIWEVEGGKGKSNILRSAASVWGDPAKLIMLKNDTNAARFQFYSTYKNLPVFIDEITTINSDLAADLIYDIANGHEKQRSNSSGTNVTKPGSWATASLFTSNTALYELLRGYKQQSNATSMRVIEMKCDFEDYTGTPTAQYIENVLKITEQNYGHAGPAFLEYCFSNPSVFDEVQQKAHEFVKRYQKHSDERFWMYGTIIPLFCGEIACRAGLINYDIPALTQWATNVMLPTLRLKVKTLKPTGSNILSEYLNEHLKNTLMVKDHLRTNTQPDAGMQCGDSFVIRYPNDALFIRLERDNRMAYISAKHFSKWCVQNGISLDIVLDDLTAKKRFDKVTGKKQIALGRQVSQLDRSKVMAYEIRMTDEEIEDVVPEASL